MAVAGCCLCLPATCHLPSTRLAARVPPTAPSLTPPRPALLYPAALSTTLAPLLCLCCPPRLAGWEVYKVSCRCGLLLFVVPAVLLTGWCAFTHGGSRGRSANAFPTPLPHQTPPPHPQSHPPQRIDTPEFHNIHYVREMLFQVGRLAGWLQQWVGAGQQRTCLLLSRAGLPLCPVHSHFLPQPANRCPPPLHNRTGLFGAGQGATQAGLLPRGSWHA